MDLYDMLEDELELEQLDHEQALISKKKKRTVFSVDREFINSKAYHDKFEKLPISKEMQEIVYLETGKLLEFVDGLPEEEMEQERLTAISARNGKLIVNNFNRPGNIYKTGFSDKEMKRFLDYDGNAILIHNHSHDGIPSGTDIKTYYEVEKIKLSIIACHNGDVYAIYWVRDKFVTKYNEILEIEKTKTTDIMIAKRRTTTQMYELNNSLSDRHKYFRVEKL